MRIIATNLDKNIMNIKHVCYTCHYTYDVDMNTRTCEETLNLGPADNGNKSFIQLLEKQFYQDGLGGLQRVNLYACPRCMTVQLCEEEIGD